MVRAMREAPIIVESHDMPVVQGASAPPFLDAPEGIGWNGRRRYSLMSRANDRTLNVRGESFDSDCGI